MDSNRILHTRAFKVLAGIAILAIVGTAWTEVTNPSIFSATTDTSLSAPGFMQTDNSINTSWVAQFMSNVSATREKQGSAPLAESSTLDGLASQRFRTMTSGNNWEITHYGGDSQLPSGSGEVVFYPSGYTPANYVPYLQTQALLHWQIVEDPAFRSYGFYVGQGYTVEVNQGCPVTELPGPNINVTQFFAQHGCTTTKVTSTWLVIDLG